MYGRCSTHSSYSKLNFARLFFKEKSISWKTHIPHAFLMILSNCTLFLGLIHQTQTSSSQLLSYQLIQSLSERISNTMNKLVRHIRLPQVLKSVPFIKNLRMKKYLDSLSNYAPWISDWDKHFAQINKTHTNTYKHKYLTD